MKKILFPTDFSENSLNAFRYALHLAAAIEAEIFTLHVYDGPEGFYQEYYDFLIENYTITEWDEFENYKSTVPKLKAIAEDCQLGHVRLSHILERGTPLVSILELAASENVDYVVMGTKGASGLREIFMGSLTEKVINASKVPVVAIPGGCFYQPVKKVLFLCHYKKKEVALLKKVLALAELFPAQLDVLQVKAHHETGENDVIAEWRLVFPQSAVAFYDLISQDYEVTVMDFIKSNKENLVVIPSHHKHFLDKLFLFSLSRKLAFHSAIPLITLPV